MKSPKNIVTYVWSHSPSELFARLTGSRSGAAVRSQAKTPYWCLSTGRVGTQTLASLVAGTNQIRSFHEPRPKLYALGRLAYESHGETSAMRILDESVRVARQTLVDQESSDYFESAPQLTFLAPSLYRVFDRSKFIHVVRHPADVIRSGMRRGWYAGHSHDRWRIEPLQSSVYAEQWKTMSAFEKNAWLWTETNQWILSFLKDVPHNRVLLLKSENFFSNQSDAVDQFFSFLGIDKPEPSRLRKLLTERHNRQVTGDFPDREDWSVDQERRFDSIAGPVMRELGYT